MYSVHSVHSNTNALHITEWLNRISAVKGLSQKGCDLLNPLNIKNCRLNSYIKSLFICILIDVAKKDTVYCRAPNNAFIGKE